MEACGGGVFFFFFLAAEDARALDMRASKAEGREEDMVKRKGETWRLEEANTEENRVSVPREEGMRRK